MPGLVDGHVHFTGAAGDEGLSSQTPPISARHFLEAGVTTAVGCLGFGAVTEDARALYAKALTLDQEGITTYVYTGAFRVPTPTITGSVPGDIVLMEKVLGVKVAIGDAYCSHPTVAELVRLASEAFAAGLQSGKPGLLHVHVGHHGDGFALLEEVQRVSGVPSRQFLPTHCNWSDSIVEHASSYARSGGFVDLSTVLDPARGSVTSVRASAAVRQMLESGVPGSSISLSSDGNVGMPVRAPDGVQTGLYLERVSSLWDEVCALARAGMPLVEAAALASENPARRLGLFPRKGSIGEGSDADMLVLNDDLSIHTVVARGVPAWQAGVTLLKTRLAIAT